MTNPNDSGVGEVRVRRARVDSLSLYEVTESELNDLTTGGNGSLFLNFAIFFLSMALALLIALKTTTISDNRTFDVFVLATLVSSVAGVVLLVLWWKSWESTRSVVARIKARMPADDGMDLDESQPDSLDIAG